MGGVTRLAGLLSLVFAEVALCELESYVYDENLPIIAADNITATGCHQACSSMLSSGHTDLEVYYPELPNDFDYYAQQQLDLVPLCVVRPKAVDAVSSTLKAVMKYECPFAVRSGGHSTATGKSNRHDGVVIDLAYFDHIRISEDQQTISLGPGARWGTVYNVLEPLGLGVVGGRVSDVGVGGFTLGGGISFLSRGYGWAFDNVLSFEVVLPNGTVVRASETSQPDLYFALRGGGSNFGVVTDFEFQAREDYKLWGGTNAYLMDDLNERRAALSLQYRKFELTAYSAVLHASRWAQKAAHYFGYGRNSKGLIADFVTLAHSPETQSHHAYIWFVWTPLIRGYLIGGTVSSTELVENPEATRNLSKPTGLLSTNRFTTLSDLAKEITTANPINERQLWRTATFKVDAELISKLWDIQMEESDPIVHVVPGLVVSSNLQIVSKPQIALSTKRGGNAFGIDVEDGPLFIFSMTISYKSADQDEMLMGLSDRIISRGIDLAKSMGLHHSFIYPNYATADQEVLEGYSPKTLQRLKDIQAVIDPERKFASLQPEQFRLS